MDYRPSALLRVAAPLKSLLQRFMYLGLIGISVGLMLVGKIDAVMIDYLRAQVTNVAAPLLAGLSKPVATFSNSLKNFRELASIREENARLMQENANLKQWLHVARRLQMENTSLKALLHSVNDGKPNFATARVIASTMGSFSNSLVINAGLENGIKKGQAVLSDRGFVGRISAVAENSARLLLATDINSRVPVILESTRTRAVMVGRNTGRPKLIHLPSGAQITSSERVVTSGHGGVLPPGIPVGVVATNSNQGIEVLLFTDYHRLEFVRIVEFGLAGLVNARPIRNLAVGSPTKRR